MAASQRVVVVSDIHFDLHHKAGWAAFRAWHKDVRPDKTVFLGDFLDFGMLSRYVQEADAPVRAIPQIRMFVREANALAEEAGEVLVLEGNHDERWGKIVGGANAQALLGAKGLSLHDQCVAHGLREDITWRREDILYAGARVGPFVLRHGHNQSGRFGAPVHLAANRLTKSMGVSEVFGHHHRGQLMARTAHGRMAVAIANPCLTRPHHYAPGADWQLGFTHLEVFGAREEHATAFPVLMTIDGAFAWGGKVYDGPDLLRRQRIKRKRDKERRAGGGP